MDAQHTKHVTSKLAYHFVWCPKYRKKMLVGKLATVVEQEIRRRCEATTWTVGALNVQADPVHLFLGAPPSGAPSPIAPPLKDTTARKGLLGPPTKFTTLSDCHLEVTTF